MVVALDSELDDALLREGLARDLVRTLNDMRKAAGFDISDRIVTYYAVSEDGEEADRSLVKGALAEYPDYIRAETLSTELREESAPEGAYVQQEKVGTASLVLGVHKNVG